MTIAFALTLAYLAINLGLMIWLERERAHGRPRSGGIATIAAFLRYGPPLAGVISLIAISGDWLFFGFIIGFFALAAWLMNGLLAFTDPGPYGRDHGRDDF